MRLLIAIAVIACALPAQADECITSDDYAAAIEILAPGSLPMEHLEGDLSTAFMSAYNAFPPVSETVGDEVMLWALRGRAVAVIFFNDGCLTSRSKLTMPATMQIREQAQEIFDGGGI